MASPSLRTSNLRGTWSPSGRSLLHSTGFLAAFSGTLLVVLLTAFVGRRGAPSLGRNVALSWLCFVVAVCAFWNTARVLPAPFRLAVAEREPEDLRGLANIFFLAAGPSLALAWRDIWSAKRFATGALGAVPCLPPLANLVLHGATPSCITFAVATPVSVFLATIAVRRDAPDEPLTTT